MDVPSEPVEEKEPELVRSVDTDVPMSQEILDAFRANDVDMVEQNTTLHDRIDPDALNELGWENGGDFRVAFSLWSHRVVLTPEVVRLYSLASGYTSTQLTDD